ncbi:MAG: cation transporter [Melioribacteraceae bacterium]
MNKTSLLNKAYWLAIITIAYNLVEGTISVIYGLEDETLALFGFGVDSFVEVISGVGILHMVIRMKNTEIETHDRFEKTALTITGYVFYVLAIGLVVGSAISIYLDIKPETTIVGIIVSLISIVTMYFLMNAKLKVGKALDSAAIIADANCTKTCFYLSFILLAASALYSLFGIQYFDSLGSIGIAYFAYSEGKEALEKVKTGNMSCGCDSHCKV